MWIAALSDLHGIRSRFEAARRLVDAGIKTLLLGGDIAQNGPPEFQQANVRACFDILLSGKKDVRIFAIPGTVCLFHCPPFGFFDFGMGIGSGTEGHIHIGSRSIAEFIRKNDPWLTIHGHSHEAVSTMKGEFSFSIGGSRGVVVGAGNDPAVLNGVAIDVFTRSLRRLNGDTIPHSSL